MARITIVLLGAFLVATWVPGQECPKDILTKTTDNFSFIASSAKGAVGDVVGLDIALEVDAAIPNYILSGIEVVACYDSEALELIGQPQYTPEFDQLFYLSQFYHSELQPLPSAPKNTQGFEDGGNVRTEVAQKFFSSPDPVPLMTVFFRVKGTPGTKTSLAFCDDTLGCDKNTVHYFAASPDAGYVIDAQSTRHQGGTVEILTGPATKPNPPPPQPLAKVYPAAPTPAMANIRLELTGAVARPDSTDIPMDLYATSGYEFSGYSLSVTFPAQYLQLASVEQFTRPGVVHIDNGGGPSDQPNRGHLGMVMANSQRRVGAENERVHIARLHFSTTARTAEVVEITPAFEDVPPYTNWLVIYTSNGMEGAAASGVNVSPIVLNNGLLKIQAQPTTRGDVNLDYEVNLTDAIAILGDLFLGTEEVLCLEAADFDENGTVNISDAIGILNHLFLGTTVSLSNDVDCNT